MQKPSENVNRLWSCQFSLTGKNFECVTLRWKLVPWVCSDCGETFADILFFVWKHEEFVTLWCKNHLKMLTDSWVSQFFESFELCDLMWKLVGQVFSDWCETLILIFDFCSQEYTICNTVMQKSSENVNRQLSDSFFENFSCVSVFENEWAASFLTVMRLVQTFQFLSQNISNLWHCDAKIIWKCSLAVKLFNFL